MNVAASERIDPDQFDEYGLLKHTGLWSQQLARHIAADIGVGPLSDAHWRIIEVMREHYARYGSATAMHKVCHEARIERRQINELFGYCLNAWRVAGLPDPGEEAKSYLSNM